MNDIFENYKSPITIYSDFENQILQEQENQIMCKIRTVVDVDKDELIKMANYDRNQYEAGYKAGFLAARKHGHWIVRTNFESGCREIRCSECEKTGFWRTEPLYCPYCGAIMEESEAEK